MAIRITGADAARLTIRRQQELELALRQAEEIERQKRAGNFLYQRGLQRQFRVFLKTALDGFYHCDVTGKLVGGAELLDIGFEIKYFDEEKFANEIKIRTQEKQIHEERERITEEKALSIIDSKLKIKIDDFIENVKAHDRYKEFSITKDNIVRRFISCISSYRNEICYANSPPDVLFFQLFDGSLFLYKPIDIFKSKVQCIQDLLHRQQKIRKNLPDVSYDMSIDESPAIANIKHSDGNISAANKFSRYLRKDDFSKIMMVKNSKDFFRVFWGKGKYISSWSFGNLNSAEALAWLSFSSGQEYLDFMAFCINKAIDEAKFGIVFKLQFSDWRWRLIGFDKNTVPQPSQMVLILKSMKFKAQCKDVVNGDSIMAEVAVNW